MLKPQAPRPAHNVQRISFRQRGTGFSTHKRRQDRAARAAQTVALCAANRLTGAQRQRNRRPIGGRDVLKAGRGLIGPTPFSASLNPDPFLSRRIFQRSAAMALAFCRGLRQ